MERQWYTYDRVPVPDIAAAVRAALLPDTQIKIGCDAQRLGKKHHFVTVLILYQPGHGGRVYFSKEVVADRLSLWEKLSKETWSSLEVAMYIEGLLGDKARIEVHVDANDDPQYRSSDYVKTLVGMVMGQGFKCVIKPDSLASSHAADQIVKGRNMRSQERRRYLNPKRSRRKFAA